MDLLGGFLSKATRLAIPGLCTPLHGVPVTPVPVSGDSTQDHPCPGHLQVRLFFLFRLIFIWPPIHPQWLKTAHKKKNNL